MGPTGDIPKELLWHKPWVGERYESEGLGGQRIAVVGYSHYVGADEFDYDEYTIDTVQGVIDGRRIAFFSAIQSYFREQSSDNFWQRVVFFNVVPWSIGGANNRYGMASEIQIASGKIRFLKIIENYTPNKVIVFSTKGWCELPETAEEANGVAAEPLRRLGSDFPTVFWGTYQFSDFAIEAFGLRHPQGASKAFMTAAISEIMERPVMKLRSRI